MQNIVNTYSGFPCNLCNFDALSVPSIYLLIWWNIICSWPISMAYSKSSNFVWAWSFNLYSMYMDYCKTVEYWYCLGLAWSSLSCQLLPVYCTLSNVVGCLQRDFCSRSWFNLGDNRKCIPENSNWVVAGPRPVRLLLLQIVCENERFKLQYTHM